MKEHLSKSGIYFKTTEFKPEMETLVFVHGITSSSSVWKQFEETFGGKFNIVSMDLRGHGKSEKYHRYEDYSIKHFAKDLHEIIDSLDIKEFILVSHSLGTLIALQYLLSYPGKASKAIFLSPGFGLSKSLVAKAAQVMLKLSWTFELKRFDPKTGKHIDYSKYKRFRDWDFNRILRDLHNTSWHVAIYCLRQIFEINTDENWQQLKTPSLIIHGKRDKVVPVRQAKILSGLMPNSRTIFLEKANHMLYNNSFEEIAREMENFILGPRLI